MKYSQVLPYVTKPLGNCSGNQTKIHLKSHLGIKCHFQNIKVIRPLRTVPQIFNGGDWGCNVRDLETIILLVLLAFNFFPQKSHQSHQISNPAKC